jgi:hypothetical protein
LPPACTARMAASSSSGSSPRPRPVSTWRRECIRPPGPRYCKWTSNRLPAPLRPFAAAQPGRSPPQPTKATTPAVGPGQEIVCVS